MKDKCPWCKKTHCIPEVVFGHAHSYHSNSSKTLCVHCGGAIHISLSQPIIVDDVEKGYHKEGDWGGECTRRLLTSEELEAKKKKEFEDCPKCKGTGRVPKGE